MEEPIKRKTARSKIGNDYKNAMREGPSKAQKSGYEIEKTIDVKKLPLPNVVEQIAKECNLDLDENNYKKNIKSSI